MKVKIYIVKSVHHVLFFSVKLQSNSSLHSHGLVRVLNVPTVLSFQFNFEISVINYTSSDKQSKSTNIRRCVVHKKNKPQEALTKQKNSNQLVFPQNKVRTNVNPSMSVLLCKVAAELQMLFCPNTYGFCDNCVSQQQLNLGF